jgi:hypothetical protein
MRMPPVVAPIRGFALVHCMRKVCELVERRVADAEVTAAARIMVAVAAASQRRVGCMMPSEI